MEKMFLAIKFAAALVGVLLMIGSSIGSSKGMPDYAKVYVDDATKTYLAPPSIIIAADFRIITAGEARKLGYRPDGKSRDEGAFIQEGHSLTEMFLETSDILKPIPPRWNEDGSWNY